MDLSSHHHYDPSWDDVVFVTMAEEPTEPIPPWVQVRVRPDFDPKLDTHIVDGISTLTTERMIVDLAEDLLVVDLIEIIDTAAGKGMIDFDKLEATIERIEHPRGKRVARQALEHWRSGTDLDLVCD